MEQQIYLVGGAVRDQLLGLEPKDKDYVAVGFTAQHFIDEGYKQVGKDFPVFLDEEGNEIALARLERNTGKSHTDFICETVNVTLEEDLKRRDLTINSMAMDSEGNIFDPFGGQEDLKNKILRHTSDAFAEDPLRVLRVARFKARFPDFEIYLTTSILCNNLRAELEYISKERIWKETEKALKAEKPSEYFKALNDMGLLHEVFPELHAMSEEEQNPVHHAEGNVFVHAMMVLDQLNGLANIEPETLYACIYHDIGKPYVGNGPMKHAGHDSEGLVTSLMSAVKARYNVPNSYIKRATAVAVLHHRFHSIELMTSKKIAKLYQHKFLPKTFEEFDQFLYAVDADARGRICEGEQGVMSLLTVSKLFIIYNRIKQYSPAEKIKKFTEQHGYPPKPETIKQFIHKKSIKIINEVLER